MALKTEIKIKLSRERIEALHKLYEWMIARIVPSDNLEHLLRAHLVDLFWRLEVQLNKDGKNFQFAFSESEAMAFCLLWGEWDLDDKYTQVIVNEIIAKVDHSAKSPRKLHARR